MDESAYRILVAKPKETVHLQDLGVGRTIILN
jgi:hypothetical protein